MAAICTHCLATSVPGNRGAPTGYDITVTKKGANLDTEYTVQPSPHKPTPEEAEKAMRTTKIDLTKLFEGKESVERSAALNEFDKVADGDANGTETTIE